MSEIKKYYYKLFCIVLYCIIRPYTEGQLDRYRIPRELSEIRTQPWLSEESLTCETAIHITTGDQSLYDNWKCSIQPRIFTHQILPESGLTLRSECIIFYLPISSYFLSHV